MKIEILLQVVEEWIIFELSSALDYIIPAIEFHERVPILTNLIINSFAFYLITRSDGSNSLNLNQKVMENKIY